MVDYTTYLDLYDIFVNELIGDALLFVILVLLITSILLVRSRVPSVVFGITLFAVGGILSTFFYPTPIRILMAIFGLGFAGWMIARIRRE